MRDTYLHGILSFNLLGIIYCVCVCFFFLMLQGIIRVQGIRYLHNILLDDLFEIRTSNILVPWRDLYHCITYWQKSSSIQISKQVHKFKYFTSLGGYIFVHNIEAYFQFANYLVVPPLIWKERNPFDFQVLLSRCEILPRSLQCGQEWST